MKNLILIFCFSCLYLASYAAVDVPIKFHNRSDINLIDGTEADGVYTFFTTGGDPYVSSDKTLITTADHCLFSFEYICEEGLDEVVIYFSSPAAEGYTVAIPGLAATKDWKTATINLKNNPNWEKTAVQTVLRIDLGNFAGKTIKIRNAVMKATPITPVTLNTAIVSDLTVTESAGTYSLSTTGSNPTIDVLPVSVSTADHFILTFEYLALAGLDQFQFYFAGNGQTFSEDKSAILSDLAASADWKKVQINLKNSDGLWNKIATQTNFRIKTGTTSGKTIQLRNINITDGSGLLKTSFPLKLDLTTQSSSTTATETAIDTWSILTKGSDPNVSTVGFSEMYNPSLVKYLSFEYKSTTGISDMDVYFYNPSNGGPVEVSPDYLSRTLSPIPPAADWSVYVVDMGSSPKWKDAGSFRLDFGNDAGKSFEIRNIRISDSTSIESTVSFDTQSSVVVNSVKTGYKTTISAPLVSVRIGFNLVGWYKEAACTNEWIFATDQIRSDVKLYAKWIAVKTYTTTFDSQGGSAVSAIVANENSILLAPTPPAKANYEFNGWYKEAACINPWNFVSGKVSSDMTLYARWAGFSVSFDSRGGTAVDKIAVENNSLIPEPVPPTKDGYTFDGWYKEFLCINAWDFATEKVSATTTLYARWITTEIPMTVVQAPSRLQYFGFYLVDTFVDDAYDGVKKSNYTDEVAGFTNLNQMAVFNPTDNVVSRVNLMDSQCTKPFLGLENIFWYEDGKQLNGNRQFKLFADFKARWNTFKSINLSVLTAAKVGCFYMADEPLWNGIPFSELNAVCKLVKTNFPEIPVFYVEAYPVLGGMQIPLSVDWVGFDRYHIFNPSTNTTFLNDLKMLKSKRSRPNQKIFLVPDTRWIPEYKTAYNKTPEDMTATIKDYYDLAVADTSIIGMVGYIWPGGFDGPGSLGLRNLSQSAIDLNVEIGTMIKANNSPCASGQPVATPSGLTVSDVSLTSCLLKWDTSLISTPGTTTYEVLKGGVSVGRTTNTEMMIYGLTCGTAYSLTVKALAQGSQWSGESSAVKFTTSECVPCTLPDGWFGVSIGANKQEVCESNGTFAITGAGYDLANNAKWFRYTYKPLNGDGAIIAKVESIQNDDPWAKSGVMIREGFENNSKHVDCFVTPANGIAFQVKPAQSGITSLVSQPGIFSPYWVKLERIGNAFNSYSSPDGVSWKQVGKTETVEMPAKVFIGLAVISHSTAYCYSTISNVRTSGETTAIDANGRIDEMTVFPNPVSSKLTVKGLPKDAVLSIVSIDGKLIMSVNSGGNNAVEFDVTGWTKGVYLLKVQSNKNVTVQKVIVE